MLVAVDSNSPVTRPPTHLLAAALAIVLRTNDELLVCILPSYTDIAAAEHLKSALLPDFAERVFTLPAEPKPSLLETAALIDQADLFVSGDTGVMHLAAATKRVKGAAGAVAPRNAVKIIALFGGSNPDVWGYAEHTTIVGKGRKEQRAFRPGFVKELYHAQGKDFFEHISPQQLAQAIARQVTLWSSSDQLNGTLSSSPEIAVSIPGIELRGRSELRLVEPRTVSFASTRSDQ